MTSPAPPRALDPSRPPFTHTCSRSAASRAAQASPSASAVRARRCASSSCCADLAAAASQRARASADARREIRLEPGLLSAYTNSKFIVCTLFMWFVVLELNLCAVCMTFTCYLHSFSEVYMASGSLYTACAYFVAFALFCDICLTFAYYVHFFHEFSRCFALCLHLPVSFA